MWKQSRGPHESRDNMPVGSTSQPYSTRSNLPLNQINGTLVAHSRPAEAKSATVGGKCQDTEQWLPKK